MKNLRIKAVLAIYRVDENGDEYGDPDRYEPWDEWLDSPFDQINPNDPYRLRVGDEIQFVNSADIESTYKVLEFWMQNSAGADGCDVKLFIGCKPLP